MLARIFNIFSKKKQIVKINTNLDISNDQDYKKLWKPDDKLYREYTDYINSLDSYKRLNIQLNDFIQKKERLLKLIENSETTSFDKILYNQEILDITDQITIVNNKINKIDQKNNILDKWNNYINEARDFLKNNEMDSYIATKDILNSTNIVFLIKKCKDQIAYSVKTNEAEHTIIKLLETHINKKSVNIKGNLLNFSLNDSELLKNNNMIQLNNNSYYSYLE